MRVGPVLSQLSNQTRFCSLPIFISLSINIIIYYYSLRLPQSPCSTCSIKYSPLNLQKILPKKPLIFLHFHGFFRHFFSSLSFSFWFSHLRYAYIFYFFFFLLQALLEIRKINGFLFSGKLEVDICFVDMFDQIWTTPCILPKLELD